MPPRGNSAGFDLTPILTHYFFLLTSILAFVGWFIAFIGQAVATAQFGHGAVGTLWFAIFLEAFLILGVFYTLATDSIAMHRFQISTFGAVAIVFSVDGVNQGIFAGTGSLDAMAAGWLILAMVNIVWVLYFTSEEDSLALHIFNMLGTGGLTPPSRRRRARSTHDLGGNGYTGNYGTGGGIGSDMGYDTKVGGMGMGSGIGGGSQTMGVRSQNSFGGASEGGGAATRSLGTGAAGSVNNLPAGAGPGSTGGGDMGGPNSPLMSATSSTPMGAGPGADAGGNDYLYKAKALYSYAASADDPNEVSFTKGEILDILDKQGKWWQAKKADGSVGIAPSNYLQLI
ncbi:Osmosensor protein [Mycena chlorophos]|uniref:Osmosensor protein n=2 Tax=Mycena chlorophos TaxID=658473 RepID=A0A146I6R5_MYCCL|nr:Osmosensor protein [Mycena chlorophos]GAT55672.1 osmosensor protein [Mycena chlorophos]